MKIAIITNGDPNNMKGVLNYVQEKLNRIQNDQTFDFDFYLIRHRDSFILNKLFKRGRREKKELKVQISNVVYNNLWIKHTLLDMIFTTKFGIFPINDSFYLDKQIDRFSKYDLIVSHWLDAHYIAYEVKKKFNIPFVSTWHGSDINFFSFSDKKRFEFSKKIIENANSNFFVSKKLMLKSNEITNKGIKDYIYTGPSNFFYKYNNEDIKRLKQKHSIINKKIICFIGNLIPVKNVLILPDVFYNISSKINSDNLIYWIIGNGKLEMELIKKLDENDVKYKMFGKVDPENVPELMNCIDILVLPSLNEGLPLVTLEALACGVNVVGSNVGGIPESIGKENCFDLDENFVDNISNRIIEILENNEKPKPLSPEFSWEYAIEKEVNIYKRILNWNF